MKSNSGTGEVSKWSHNYLTMFEIMSGVADTLADKMLYSSTPKVNHKNQVIAIWESN
jgi:hypothetical protein